MIRFTFPFFLLVAVYSGVIYAAEDQIKIKNFRQWPLYLESSTNISRFYPEIDGYFSKVYSTYPKKGTLDEIRKEFIFSNISYSSYFCKRMIERDSQLIPDKRWMHTSIDFGKLNQTPDTWKITIQEYGEIFLGRSFDQTELNLLLELQKYLEKPHNGEKRPLDLINVLVGICVSAATNTSSFLIN